MDRIVSVESNLSPDDKHTGERGEEKHDSLVYPEWLSEAIMRDSTQAV